LINHLGGMTDNQDNLRLTKEEILSHIYYYRVHDYIEQIALVNLLPKFLSEHTKVRLLVIDSITFHFRHDFDDMNVRTRILNQMGQSLLSAAERFNIAVVVINQVTTKMTGESQSNLVPALGESWGHTCTNRIILYWNDSHRYAHLNKSPSREAKTVPFQVTTEGIRSIDE